MESPLSSEDLYKLSLKAERIHKPLPDMRQLVDEFADLSDVVSELRVENAFLKEQVPRRPFGVKLCLLWLPVSVLLSMNVAGDTVGFGGHCASLI